MHIENRYVEPSKTLSLERAVQLDKRFQDQSSDFSLEAYQQPVLTEKNSQPVRETDAAIMAEVLENLERLQSKAQPGVV